jgi:hypothetical protein
MLIPHSRSSIITAIVPSVDFDPIPMQRRYIMRRSDNVTSRQETSLNHIHTPVPRNSPKIQTHRNINQNHRHSPILSPQSINTSLSISFLEPQTKIATTPHLPKHNTHFHLQIKGNVNKLALVIFNNAAFNAGNATKNTSCRLGDDLNERIC